MHPSKQYLKQCLKEIEEFLAKEKLQLNTKTRIYKDTNNFVFLGRNKYGKYAKYRQVRRRLKRKMYLYRVGKTNIAGLMNSIINFKNLMRKNSYMME